MTLGTMSIHLLGAATSVSMASGNAGRFVCVVNYNINGSAREFI